MIDSYERGFNIPDRAHRRRILKRKEKTQQRGYSLMQYETFLNHGQFSVTGRAFCHSALECGTERFFTMGTGVGFQFSKHKKQHRVIYSP